MPRYWRPPYGDSDLRVRSIAKEVKISFAGSSLLVRADLITLGLRSRDSYLESRVSQMFILRTNFFRNFVLLVRRIGV